jgi:hypothetical protein
MKEAKSENAVGKWIYVSRTLEILQFVSIIGGLVFGGIQLGNIAHNQAKDQSLQEIQFLREFKKELTTGVNGQIYDSIVRGEKILKLSGGKFSDEELKEYISLFNQLSLVAGRKFINGDIVYSFFYFYIANTFENKEVQAYLQILRKNSPNRYSGLNGLYKYIKDYQTYLEQKTP